MPDYTTTIGNVEILALSDGSIRFAPTDFFPSIPKEAWEPYSADLTPDGEMVMNLGCFLLRSEGKTVLIDTGLGLDSGHLDTLEMGRLLIDMQEKGVNRTDADVVGITHLHIDHVGWNFMYDDDSEQDSEVERSGAAQTHIRQRAILGETTLTGACSLAARFAGVRTSPRKCCHYRNRAS